MDRKGNFNTILLILIFILVAYYVYETTYPYRVQRGFIDTANKIPDCLSSHNLAQKVKGSIVNKDDYYVYSYNAPEERLNKICLQVTGSGLNHFNSVLCEECSEKAIDTLRCPILKDKGTIATVMADYQDSC